MTLIRKYTAEVTRVDTFEISVDKKIWDTKALKDWSNIFVPAETVKDLAAHLAQLVARQGTTEFYEGFGRVKTTLKNGYSLTQFKKNDAGEWVALEDKDYCSGIIIRVISEDNDCEVAIEKAKELQPETQE